MGLEPTLPFGKLILSQPRIPFRHKAILFYYLLNCITLFSVTQIAAFDFTKRCATLTGLEPATSAVTGRRANQLRYRAIIPFQKT
jgi:hypothetical protein